MRVKTLLIEFMAVMIFYDLVIAGSLYSAQADLQKNGFRQKIGDYEVGVTTTPSSPSIGKITNIMVSINVSNSDLLLTDIPMIIKITKNDEEISMSNPIFVSGGHLNYPYAFKSAGIFGLEINILKNSIEGDIPTNILTSFEFPLQVSDAANIPFVPITIGAFLAGAGIVVLAIRRNYGIFSRLHKSNTK